MRSAEGIAVSPESPPRQADLQANMISMYHADVQEEEPAAPAGKVKRPATAYSRFVKENYGSIAAQHPDKKGVKQLGKIVGEQWAALSDAEKVRAPVLLGCDWGIVCAINSFDSEYYCEPRCQRRRRCALRVTNRECLGPAGFLAEGIHEPLVAIRGILRGLPPGWIAAAWVAHRNAATASQSLRLRYKLD